MRAIIFLSMAAILLGACGSDPGSAAKTEDDKRRALEESAFGDLAGTLDTASDVERLNAERKQQLDQAIAESEDR